MLSRFPGKYLIFRAPFQGEDVLGHFFPKSIKRPVANLSGRTNPKRSLDRPLVLYEKTRTKEAGMSFGHMENQMQGGGFQYVTCPYICLLFDDFLIFIWRRFPL